MTAVDGLEAMPGGLCADPALARFVNEEVLPGLSLAPDMFWPRLADIYARFTGENRSLLLRRAALQAQIDAWHSQHAPGTYGPQEQLQFLREIGYLVGEPADFTIGTHGVDIEVARRAGPQLVVPAMNARFALNAANARWGSLYDALYGSDVLGPPPRPGGYDEQRGQAVVAWTAAFLDDAFPLTRGGHLSVRGWAVVDGALQPPLSDPNQFAGWRGDPLQPEAILLRRNGLHVELQINHDHPVGRTHPAGLCDVLLEAALTSIVDFEDSVAAVDAEDKVAAYATWLGLMRGDLAAVFRKDGVSVERELAPDRPYVAPDGSAFALPGRALLFVRNVGHLMTTPALQLPDGEDALEGILDTMMSALIGLYDLRGLGRLQNSRAESIYIVKPKMHGPDEVGFANRLFDAVEDALGLERYTLKMGVMDEERRTSANLKACIAAARDRVVFINTGFLDRTGDEIHTSMRAGSMVRKADIKSSRWIAAYEQRNVAIALACGFSGRAQIGKGMWAAPDSMADMVAQKSAHPAAGATTAWVPSPTAATLHAMHYHQVDVFARHRALSECAPDPLTDLLTPPLAESAAWTQEEIRAELDNNCQSLLGYVTRWIDQGIGCSKVPDLDDVGLMEDRATLRISAQHLANWLMHGVCGAEDLEDSLRRMAYKVDAQNAQDPAYRRMSADWEGSAAFQAARALIFRAATQPNGYTEPLLHQHRLDVKRRARATAKRRGYA
jgi:malate synthase